MARFKGIPVEQETAVKGPRFSGVPVAATPPRYDGTDASNGFLDLAVPGMDTTRPEPAAASSGYDQSDFAQVTSGLNEGLALAAGAPVDLANLPMAGADAVAEMFGGDLGDYSNPVGGSQWVEDWLMQESIKPETDNPGQQWMRRGMQDVGAAVIPTGAVASRAAQPIRTLLSDLFVAGGTGAGAATAEQVLPDEPWAEFLASLFGGATAVATKAGVKKAITPFPSSPTKQAAAATMAEEGVDLTAGQATGSQGLRYAEAELGGGAAQNFTERQGEQFTQAALSRAGIVANRATPDVIDGAFVRLGAEFDALAARNEMPLDQQLMADMTHAMTWYETNTPAAARIPLIEDVFTDLTNYIAAGNSTLPGDVYSRWRTTYDQAFRSAPIGSTQRDALLNIRNAMDDAVERYMMAANPDDAAAWRTARRHYANLLDIVPAAAAGGVNAADGILSPAQLRMAIAAGNNRRYYARGLGDFNDLVHAGQSTLAPLPQSGTAPRTAVKIAKGAVPVGAGMLAGGGDLGLDMGTLAGLLGGYGAVKGAGAAMLSGPGRRYLGNQMVGPRQGPRLVGPAAAVGLNSAEEELDPENIRQLVEIVVGRGNLAPSGGRLARAPSP